MKVIKPEISFGQPKLVNLKPIRDKLCINTHSGHHILCKNDITHLIADSNYTSIHLKDQKLVCSQTLGAVMDRINHPNFIRIHQSYVVNLDYLKKIDSAFTSVLLDGGIQLSISRSRKQFLKEMIHKRFD